MQTATLMIGPYAVTIYSKDGDMPALIEESRNYRVWLGGQYSAEKHQPHVLPSGEYHLHVYKGNNELFALNRGGTAHDDSHGKPIPNQVAKAIRAKFPGWTLPANNIIESAPVEQEAELIHEGFPIGEAADKLSFREWFLLTE